MTKATKKDSEYINYLQYRESLIKSEHCSADSFEKSTLGCSLFFLFIVFCSTMTGIEINSTFFFSWSVLFLVQSVILTPVSYMLSQQSFQKAREILDKDYVEGGYEEINPYNRWIDLVDRTKVIFFIIGVVSTTLFLISN